MLDERMQQTENLETEFAVTINNASG